MAQKILHCYTYDIMVNNKKCENRFKEMIELLFNTKQDKVSNLGNNKLGFKFDNQKEGYLSVEWIKMIKEEYIPDKYMFFRIGRQRDIDGAIKREKQTFKSKEVIDKEVQNKYELEICTYLLVDLDKSIIIEVYGKQAPSAKDFIKEFNKFIELDLKQSNMDIRLNNIFTDKLIDNYKTCGSTLDQLSYTYYNLPGIEALKNMGLTREQLASLKELDIYEVEIKIKNKPRTPLTKDSIKIKKVLDAMKTTSGKLRDSIRVKGKSGNSKSKEYRFASTPLTYNIEIQTYVKLDDESEKRKMSLDEFTNQAYLEMESAYDSKKDDIRRFILDV